MSANSHTSKNKRYKSVLHYILLFVMLHNTFVAPSQGIIETYLKIKEYPMVKGYVPFGNIEDKTLQPATDTNSINNFVAIKNSIGNNRINVSTVNAKNKGKYIVLGMRTE